MIRTHVIPCNLSKTKDSQQFFAAGAWRPSTLHSFSWIPQKTEPKMVAVELCCGMGGISIGLRSLGFRTVGAYDSWDRAVKIYNHNAPEPVAVQCDLLDDAGYKRVVSECRKIGGIDLLAAGPPCKGFSQLVNGKHHMPNPHNRVLEVIPEYVAALKPERVLIENVPNLIRHAKGQTFADFIRRLQAPGPKCLKYYVSYQIYDAALFGTPQARKRLLILAVKDSSEQLPSPGPNLSSLYTAIRRNGRISSLLQKYMNILQDDWDARIVSARQALSDIPSLDPGVEEIPRPYASEPKSAFQQIMRVGSPKMKMLENTKTPTVRTETLERLRHIPPGGNVCDIPEKYLNGLSRRFGSAYRRLHPDAPATTLSTKYDCVYHFAFHRSLSVREYARIQGIPDFVTFPDKLANRCNAYEMIGNSVPPLLVRAVIGNVLACGNRDSVIEIGSSSPANKLSNENY